MKEGKLEEPWALPDRVENESLPGLFECFIPAPIPV